MLGQEGIFTRKEWWTLLCLPLIAFTFFVLSDRRLSPYDGGFALSLALRIIHGDVPHRDFYYQYGPAQPVLFAFLFRIFGVHLLPVALMEMVIKAVTVLFAYRIVRASAPAWAAVFSSFVVALLLATAYPSAGMDVLMLVAGLTLLIGTAMEGLPSAVKCFFIGIVTGLASLYRYEQGFILLLLSLAIVILGTTTRRDAATLLIARRLLLITAGYVLIALPLFLYFAFNHALRDLWYDCFAFPAKFYHSARAMPFPASPWRHRNEYVFFLPLVVPPFVICYLLWSALQSVSKLRARINTQLLFLSALAIVYGIKGSIRVDFGQMLPGNFVIAILLGLLLARSHPRIVRVMASFAACMLLIGSLSSFKQLTRDAQKRGALAGQRLLGGERSFDADGWCESRSPAVRPFCFAMDKDHERAAMYVMDRMSPGQKIYIGLSRHDRIVANDNFSYFAIETVPAIKWSLFDVDLQNRADIQSEMVVSLQQNKPEFAVETSEFEGNTEPNDSSKSSGVYLLDDFLKRTYSPVANFGKVTVLQRRLVSPQ